MLKIVLDTNIIVSAVVFGRLPASILEDAIEGEFTNVISLALLHEVENVLVNKFRWQVKDAQDVVKWLLSFSELVEPQECITDLAYQPDNKILECAVAGQAKAIVTGDRKHLLPLKQYRDIVILSANEFLQWFPPTL